MVEPRNSPITRHETGFRQTWDTFHVPLKERFSYFREGVCQAFLAFSPEQPRERDLVARVDMAQLPRGLISKVAVTPHRVVRSRTDVAKMPGEYLSLGLQITGGFEGDMDGRPYTQKAGNLAVVHANKIKSIDLFPHERYTTTAVLFERSLLSDFPKLKNVHSIENAYQQPLTSCLALITERYGSASQAEMTKLFDASLSLLVASLIYDNDYLEDRCAKDETVRGGILQTIQKFVGDDLSNPDLSTVSIAARFGLSARYIQKLFAGDGTTLKSFIVTQRLTKVRGDLLDPKLAHIPVGNIAFRWGFRDMTTFHRNFKLRFGDTPGQMRAAIKGGLVLETAGSLVGP